METMSDLAREFGQLPVQVLAILLGLGAIALAAYAIHVVTKERSK